MPMREKLNRDCAIIVHRRRWVEECATWEAQKLRMCKRNRMKTLVIEGKRNVRTIRSKKGCKMLAGSFHVELEYCRIGTEKEEMASNGKASRGKGKKKRAEEKKNIGHNLLMLKSLLSLLSYTPVLDFGGTGNLFQIILIINRSKVLISRATDQFDKNNLAIKVLSR